MIAKEITEKGKIVMEILYFNIALKEWINLLKCLYFNLITFIRNIIYYLSIKY